jgi:flagellar biosynthesis protein FlhF
MRVKSFHAPTMSEAMRQVRDELGADAVIVSGVEQNNGSVHVMAAVEPSEAGRDIASASSAKLDDAPDDTVSAALSYHGVPEALSARLARLARALELVDPTLALAGALDERFNFSPLTAAPERPLMMVGPPGVGKTVTTAKLAARAVLAGQPVHVATCDTLRAGAIEQLDAFMRLLGQPLAKAESPRALRDVLLDRTDDAVALVDSPGTNVFSADDLANLAGFAQCADLEPVLVLAAGGDPSESAEIAEAFAGIGVKRVIITRLDVTRRFGGVLASADAAHLTFSDVSITPFVGEGLSPINPVALARLLMHDPTEPQQRSELSRAMP